MPNWCNNSTTIVFNDFDKSNEAHVAFMADLVSAFTNHSFLEHICPIGEWEYHKAVDTWGTKWDVGGSSDGCEILNDDALTSGVLILSYSSAWSPPIDALAFATGREGLWSCLSINTLFVETGMCFLGEAHMIHGNYSEKFYEFHNVVSSEKYDEFCDKLSSELYEFFIMAFPKEIILDDEDNETHEGGDEDK